MHQLTDEYWCYNMAQEHHCSSLAVVHPEGHATSAQNLDVTPFYHGFQTAFANTCRTAGSPPSLDFPGTWAPPG